MATPVEQIKDKLNIADVVASYIKLEKAGANFKARCPFHNEKTPSFFISPERGSYYCFGCGAKGDIFSFVQQFEGLDFVGALRVLALRAGVPLRRQNMGEAGRERSERERLYLLHEHATLFFQRQLSGREDVLKYLRGRGLTDATLKEWRLGYAPALWQALSSYLKSKNFSDKEIETAGLGKKSEKSTGVYDRFRGRVMFPIFDAAGRVIAFSGRQFESDGTEAKYLNSPETPLFQKSRVLYGWHKARLAIREKGQAILVEGQMDLLACHQAGLINTVATSGTAMTAEHATLISRLADKLIICYDADPAGAAAAAKGFSLALRAGLDVVVATLPHGTDPADIAVQDPQKLVTFIDGARHIIEVELERILARQESAYERNKAIERDLVPYISALESPTKRSHFVVSVADATGIKEELLDKLVTQKLVSADRVEAYNPHPKASHLTSRLETVERLLWGLVFWLDQNNKQGSDTKNSALLDIRKKISTITGIPESVTREAEAAKVKDELLFEAEAAFALGEDIHSLTGTVSELLLDFEEGWLKERLATAARNGESANVMNEFIQRRRAIDQKRFPV